MEIFNTKIDHRLKERTRFGKEEEQKGSPILYLTAAIHTTILRNMYIHFN